MQTAFAAETTIPLPPSPLDPNRVRVLIHELVDASTREEWRVFQLEDGSFSSEVRMHGLVLDSEYHASFEDVSTRIDRWYDDHSYQQAA